MRVVRRGNARVLGQPSGVASRRVAERDVVDGCESRPSRANAAWKVHLRSQRKRNLTTATGRRAFAIPGRRRDARARRAV